MQIIIINSKGQDKFTSEQLKSLKHSGGVRFIETANFQNDPIFSSNEEKVIAVGPEIVSWKFPNDFIKTVKNLKAICVPTTSFSWIDSKFLRSRNIAFSNVPKYSTESVAEYAISLMLNLVKKLPLIIKNKWKLDYTKHKGWEIKGKTMGIVGLGSIGTRIAELGKAMGMNVVYWSRKNRDARFEYNELTDLIKKSDFVFPTLARNKDTEKMLNKTLINLMKKDSFIVSTTGRDLFDEGHAITLVNQGKLAGLAFESDTHDVYESNILITPPIAWFTQEASENNMKIWTENIVTSAQGKPQNVVN